MIIKLSYISTYVHIQGEFLRNNFEVLPLALVRYFLHLPEIHHVEIAQSELHLFVRLLVLTKL